MIVRRVLAAAALTVGVMAGLVAAVVTGGRMAHLRLVAGETLPAWTAGVPPESGLWQGRMPLVLPGGANGPPGALRWQLAVLDHRGPLWRLEAQAPGLRMTAQAGLSATTLRLAGVEGSAELAALSTSLPPALARMQPDGRADFRGDLHIGLRPVQAGPGQTDGRIGALVLDGHPVGSGPLSGVMDADGQWQIDLALEGGVAPASITLTGQIGSPRVRGFLRVPEAGADGLPQGWRNALGLLARQQDGHWVLEQTWTTGG